MHNSFNSLQELAHEIESKRNEMRDFILPSASAHVEDDGRHISLVSKDMCEVPDRYGSFHGVISPQFVKLNNAWNGMGNRYYDLMVQRKQFPLIAANMNTWFQNPPKGSGQRLFRTYDRGSDDANVFRSIHSEKFLTFDNFDLLDGIKPVLYRLEERMGEIQFVSMGLTDTKLYLKIIFPKVEAEILKQGRSVGDIVQSGVLISNSEVGMGSIVVSPFIYRLICLNGMTVNDSGLRKRHLGHARAVGEITYQDDTLEAMHVVLKKQLRDHVEDCTSQRQFDRTVQKIQQAADDVDQRDPEEVLLGLGKKYSLADAEVKKAKRSLFEGGDFSRWGFANAVTHLANTSDNYDRASDLQETGGNIIQMPSREWATMAKAA